MKTVVMSECENDSHDRAFLLVLLAISSCFLSEQLRGLVYSQHSSSHQHQAPQPQYLRIPRQIGTMRSDLQQELHNDSSRSRSSGSSDMSSSEVSWINWYCSLPEHEFFLEIPEQYIEDEFNLVGLSNIVPLYSEALDLILDLELDCSDTDDSTGIRPTQQQQQYNAHVRIVESSAQTLYGLIHARFLLTKPALVNMAKRFEMRDFGRCPRIGCGGCGVIPCGLSDLPGVATLSMYCPRCGDLYTPKKARFQALDGSCFGTTFASFLFLTMPYLIPGVRTSVAALQKSSERPDAAMRERAALARAREHPVLSSDENNEEAGSNDTDSDSNDDIYSDDEEDGGEEGHGKEWVSSLNSLSDYWRYTPTIFGFRVSERSPHGPRMGWLRWRSDMSGCDRPGCGESVFRAITRRRDLPDACNGVATATTLSTRAEKDKILDSYGMDVSMKSIGSVGFTGSMECISREGSIAGDFSMRAGQNVDGHMDDIETATADG
ncbi:hypothetical protein BASA61_008839 [Batrachochytrium salamandrivorans]|nr:hypothetical protein BASA61_008839 [Batrachochytrium salamandrivorans]